MNKIQKIVSFIVIISTSGCTISQDISKRPAFTAFQQTPEHIRTDYFNCQLEWTDISNCWQSVWEKYPLKGFMLDRAFIADYIGLVEDGGAVNIIKESGFECIKFRYRYAKFFSDAYIVGCTNGKRYVLTPVLLSGAKKWRVVKDF